MDFRVWLVAAPHSDPSTLAKTYWCLRGSGEWIHKTAPWGVNIGTIRA